MQPIKVKLNLERSTPGTHLYKTNETGVAVPSLYVKKSAFNGQQPPASIVVTIEAGT